MKVVGLIGGIASGKSAVAQQLESLGAKVFYADQAAHQVLDTASAKKALMERWGKSVLDSEGNVDRKAIGKIVFSSDPKSEQEKKFLEKTLHPPIREQFEKLLAKWENGGSELVVLDAPLLLEAGWQELCDVLLFVDSSREKRLQRAKMRNWTEADFVNREAAQMPITEKKRHATHVVQNDDSLESLRRQVSEFWKSLSPGASKSRKSGAD